MNNVKWNLMRIVFKIGSMGGKFQENKFSGHSVKRHSIII